MSLPCHPLHFSPPASPKTSTADDMALVAAALDRLARSRDLSQAAQCRMGQALAMVRIEAELSGPDDAPLHSHT